MVRFRERLTGGESDDWKVAEMELAECLKLTGHRSLRAFEAIRTWRWFRPAPGSYLASGLSRKRKRTSGIFSFSLLGLIFAGSSALTPYQFAMAFAYHSGGLEKVPYSDFVCRE
jgi:hypothetical protein